MVTVGIPTTVIDAFADWVRALSASFEAADPERFADLFAEDGFWRDILSFSWGYRTFSGRTEIADAFARSVPMIQPTAMWVSSERTPPKSARRSGRSVIEGYVEFETAVGSGTAFARLLYDEEHPEATKAAILLTTLQKLWGFEERVGERRPTGMEYSTHFGQDNWLDKRITARAYKEHDPDVLVIGAGQAGLTLAARLTQLGVDALVVERNDRVGDNWRNRYHSLTLHNEVWANHLPYLPFPSTWPTFLPKDMLAGWLEAYVEFMELNVWTGSELLEARYESDQGRWKADVQRADGSVRRFSVSHLVLATGTVSGAPNIPDLPGLGEFRGELVHSSQFGDGSPYAGKHAIVVGTGNSAHDMAQELYSSGAASVTMVQRSPTCVVSLVPGGTLVYELYSTGPVEDIDLITAAIPYPVLRDAYQRLTRRTSEMDQAMLKKLAAAGFKLDFGHDATGFHMQYLRRGGGYYINVGCSDLIGDGHIKVIQDRDIDHYTDSGLRMKDGTIYEADLIGLATGYQNMKESIRSMLGDEVAELVGSVWGFNTDGFMRNMWDRTAQPGFWIMGGALAECRLYSRFLGLLIKADLEGILPPAG